MGKILIKEPGKEPYLKSFEGDGPVPYDMIKKNLDNAWFDMIILRPGVRQVAAYVDDEGLLKQLRLNFILNDQPIVGPAVVVANEGEDSFGLNEEEISYCVSIFSLRGN